MKKGYGNPVLFPNLKQPTLSSLQSPLTGENARILVTVTVAKHDYLRGIFTHLLEAGTGTGM